MAQTPSTTTGCFPAGEEGELEKDDGLGLGARFSMAVLMHLLAEGERGGGMDMGTR
jgi:hypothetical protein